MAKTKKATPSPADEKVYDVETTYTNRNDNSTYDIKIKSTIPYEEMCALTQIITNGVVDDVGYYPYYYDSSFWGYIFEFYTDLDKSLGLADVTRLICETDIMEVVKKNIQLYQFNTIEDSVNKLIDFKKQKLTINSEIDSTFTGLLNDFRSLLAKANNFLDLDPDVLGKVVNNLAGMTNITESKLVNALIEKSGVAKGKGDRKADSKGKAKNNVVELQLPLQQTLENGEIPE